MGLCLVRLCGHRPMNQVQINIIHLTVPIDEEIDTACREKFEISDEIRDEIGDLLEIA
jgi:hypothetical protein